MARIFKWVAIILGVLLVAYLALVFLVGIFRFGFFNGMPMMARGFRGPLPYGGARFLFLPLLIGRLLIPLGFIALLVLLGFAIGRAFSRPQVQAQTTAGTVVSPAVSPAVATTACPNCGRPVQADWNNCPYCGTNLRSNDPPAVQEENS